MKCPYRVSTYKQIVKGCNTEIFEKAEFEDCYGEDCPLYYDEGVCSRVQNEIEGDCV